jgi:predicted TIM-barrel fold metal-dependent hydrolase
MIIDCHTHIFFPEVIKDRSKFCRRDPSFSRIYKDPRARIVGAEDLIERMKKDGVDKSIIFGFPWADPGICRDHNDYIIYSMREYPSRLIGLCSIPTDLDRKSLEELERCLDEGMMGVGEVASYDESSSGEGISSLHKVMEVLKERGLPLLLHVTEAVGHDYAGKSYTDMREIYGFILKYPDVDIILAHWGGGFFFYELMPEVSMACRRIYYDTSASPFLYSPRIYRIALDIIGPDRILFGSDYPLIAPSRYLKEIKEAHITDDHMEKILGVNAERLFRI